MEDVLKPDDLSAALTGRFGRPLRWVEQIGSTNDEALAWAAAGAPEGALVATNHQISGRGRRGRSWWSRPGVAAQFSLILRPDLPPGRLGMLTVGLGVAVAEGIEESARLEARLKWPNDVCMDGRKLAGILVETRLAGSSIEAAVAGIGINCHVRAGELPPEVRERASSVAAEVERGGGRVPRRAELIAAVVSRIEALYPAMVDESLGEEILGRAAQRSDFFGKEVAIRFPDGTLLQATARRLLPSGALEVSEDGRIRAVEIGEIEHIRPAL